jgi:hypothetical protein
MVAPRYNDARYIHAEHGAVDNVFTQFYPILRR